MGIASEKTVSETLTPALSQRREGGKDPPYRHSAMALP